MFALTIVINFYVLKNNPFYLRFGFQLTMMNQLGLDRMKERFSYCIVPAVSFSAHTLNKTVSFQLAFKISTCILNAAITVDKQAITWPSPGQWLIIDFFRALIAECRSSDGLRSQPTTILENRSMNTVR